MDVETETPAPVDVPIDGNDAAGGESDSGAERMNGRGVLTDFCARVAALTGETAGGAAIDSAEDIVCSLVGMLKSRAVGVTASGATALAAVLGLAPARTATNGRGLADDAAENGAGGPEVDRGSRSRRGLDIATHGRA